MNNSETYNIIHKVLIGKMKIRPELINNNAMFRDDFGFNDTELSLLLFYIENHFDIDIAPSAITLFSTVSDLAIAIRAAKSYNNVIIEK